MTMQNNSNEKTNGLIYVKKWTKNKYVTHKQRTTTELISIKRQPLNYRLLKSVLHDELYMAPYSVTCQLVFYLYWLIVISLRIIAKFMLQNESCSEGLDGDFIRSFFSNLFIFCPIFSNFIFYGLCFGCFFILHKSSKSKARDKQRNTQISVLSNCIYLIQQLSYFKRLGFQSRINVQMRMGIFK